MKFTNCTTLVWALCIAGVLTACTSVPVSEEARSSADVENIDTPATEPLTPFQEKVLSLKAQPNLYTQGVTESNGQLSPSIKKQFTDAVAHKAKGELAEAEALLKRLSQAQPQLSGVWLTLAEIECSKAETSSLEKCETYATNAIKANELNLNAHILIALVYRKKGQFSQALHHYNKALEVWPAFPEAYRNRGILYDLYLGEKHMALDDYTLYQALLDKPSRQVKGWMADLQRQIEAQQDSGGML
ncbi:tetratricopeptide repeat protein [Paraglaciecola sp. 2405UD69-4]|uniref:tetratricopeptide repeat protein n=1 Tax=Paraglaciecola sp. 2405UD69-4 TaxID=3391836 RepID=UPI0039C9347A